MGISAAEAQKSYRPSRRPSDGVQTRTPSAASASAHAASSAASGTANLGGGTMCIRDDVASSTPACGAAAAAGGGGDGTMCIRAGGTLGATSGLQAACAAAAASSSTPASPARRPSNAAARPGLAYDDPAPPGLAYSTGTANFGGCAAGGGDGTMCIRSGAAAGGTLGRGFGARGGAGAASGGSQAPAADSTMCIKGGLGGGFNEASGGGTMVIKPAAAAALLPSAGGGADTGAGTMLLKSAGGQVATLGGGSTPAFMRQMFGGGDATPPPPPPPAARISVREGSLESAESSPGRASCESSVRRLCARSSPRLPPPSFPPSRHACAPRHCPFHSSARLRSPLTAVRRHPSTSPTPFGIYTYTFPSAAPSTAPLPRTT